MIANLQLINDITRFNKAATECPAKVRLHSGNMDIDAKSLQSILTLNLSMPVTVKIETDDNAVIDTFKNKLVGIVIDE